MSALVILVGISALGILVDMPTFDIPAGVLDFLGDMTTLDVFGQGIPAVAEYLPVDDHADFPILDMPALDIFGLGIGFDIVSPGFDIHSMPLLPIPLVHCRPRFQIG